MANSLQEQLLKAGIVDEKRVKEAQQESRKQHRKQPKRPKSQRGAADEKQQRVQQQQSEKAARDRALNRERREAAERKAVAAQIKQMIETSRLPKGDGETAYNFVDGSKVKRLYVADLVQKQLVSGAAAIVKLHGRYDIVPAAVAEKIRERDAACIVLLNTPGQQDDDYADYPVPDDLMW